LNYIYLSGEIFAKDFTNSRGFINKNSWKSV